ncbi:MAG: PAS domain S-box protein [Anaerolineae bacterium]|nr:PAS domain S-box protein [Anaerolineae bacterium]
MLRFMQRLPDLWRWLVTPADEVLEADRQRARALTSLIVSLLAVFVPLTPFWILFDGVGDSAPPIIITFVIGMLGIAYFVSRTRRFRMAVWIMIVMLISALGAVLVTRHQMMPEADDLLKYQAFAIILASLTLSRRATLCVTAVALGMTLLTSHYILGDTSRETLNEVVFLTLVAAMTITAAILRDNYAARLSASERRYRILFEQSTDMILTSRLDETLLFANQRCLEMLEYTEADLPRLRVSDLIAPQEHTSSQEMRRRLLAGETFTPYERTVITRTGKLIPMELTVGLVRDEHGAPEYIQSVGRDLRPRRRAEKEHLQANLERERSKILARFVQGISHEFRTPLAVIATSAYLIGKAEDRALIDRRKQTIERQVDRITRLVEMMMTMVRLDAEEALNTAPLRLSEVLTNIIVSSSRMLAEANLTLTTDLEPDPPGFSGDAHLLTNAFRQLMSNAVQYTPSGGQIKICSRIQADEMIVEFRDTGIGISPVNQSRVFERFFRADEAHSSEGFGLGLSITQAIIQRHGGRVTVESAPGVGSTFRVHLPL